MDGNACMSECLYDSILARNLCTMEKNVWALPPMSAIRTSSITTSRVTRSQPVDLLKPDKKGFIVEVVRKGIVAVQCWSIC